MIFHIKKAIELLPPSFGKYVSYLPFQWRLGYEYSKSIKIIKTFNELNNEQQKNYILYKIRSLIEYAINKNDFYKDFYAKNGFNINSLVNFEDIRNIPIVTKRDLNIIPLVSRTNPHLGSFLVNTGGTTGEPLSFYLDKKSFAREWAHMHTIWRTISYKPSASKLTFRGKNLGNKKIIYNANHNEYMVNTYANIYDVIECIKQLVEKEHIDYIHGYPSAIYNFARECSRICPELIELFRKMLKGILLGSEYPAPVYRDLIKSAFGVATLSWYGHSEMAILAYEKEQEFVYSPMQSYGYCEAVADDMGNYRLIGTSYYNFASPFIRYDTGDYVTPIKNCNGILETFAISKGRIGDFILDRNSQKISLTSLIFGRHHNIFNVATYIQVQQNEPGKATLLVTLPPYISYTKDDIKNHFDASNLLIDFEYKIIPKPIFTQMGKIPLLISNYESTTICSS